MSAESVRTWLQAHASDVPIRDNGQSVATVAEAAQALGVLPERIAKTLAIRLGEQVALVVMRGDARLDNAKFKAAFGVRPRMLDAAETEALTGHPVGGVCPFGLVTELPVYCDVSIKPFDKVFPAAGSRYLSAEIAPERLCEIVGGEWVDVGRYGDQPA